MLDHNLSKCVAPFKKKGNAKTNQFDYEIPCGRCVPCLKKKSMEWAFRLYQENKASLSAFFITLTYDTKELPIVDLKALSERLERSYDETPNRRTYEKWKSEVTTRLSDVDNEALIEKIKSGKFDYRYEITLWKKDIQNFCKAMQKRELRLTGRTPKYFVAAEYGTQTERPHYHIIFFNLSKQLTPVIHEVWNKGIIRCDPVNDSRIVYVTKYLFKKYGHYDGKAQPFHINSEELGKNYIDSHASWHWNGDRFYCQWGDNKVRMPRYYKDAIWGEDSKAHKGRVREDRQREEQLEYWQKCTELRAKGIRDPESYLRATKENYIKIQEKRANNRK